MLRLTCALRSKARQQQSLYALSNELLEVQHVSGRTLMSVMGPKCYTTKGTLILGAANVLCIATYCIMLNWIYEGYVDLWYGVYGLEDDEDDEDD